MSETRELRETLAEVHERFSRMLHDCSLDLATVLRTSRNLPPDLQRLALHLAADIVFNHHRAFEQAIRTPLALPSPRDETRALPAPFAPSPAGALLPAVPGLSGSRGPTTSAVAPAAVVGPPAMCRPVPEPADALSRLQRADRRSAPRAASVDLSQLERLLHTLRHQAPQLLTHAPAYTGASQWPESGGSAAAYSYGAADRSGHEGGHHPPYDTGRGGGVALVFDAQQIEPADTQGDGQDGGDEEARRAAPSQSRRGPGGKRRSAMLAASMVAVAIVSAGVVLATATRSLDDRAGSGPVADSEASQQRSPGNRAPLLASPTSADRTPLPTQSQKAPGVRWPSGFTDAEGEPPHDRPPVVLRTVPVNGPIVTLASSAPQGRAEAEPTVRSGQGALPPIMPAQPLQRHESPSAAVRLSAERLERGPTEREVGPLASPPEAAHRPRHPPSVIDSTPQGRAAAQEKPAARAPATAKAAPPPPQKAEDSATVRARYAPSLLKVKNPAAALEVFNDLRSRHGVVLSGKSAELRTVIAADNETWYQVLAVPAGTERQAADICRQLGEEGKALGCSVMTY